MNPSQICPEVFSRNAWIIEIVVGIAILIMANYGLKYLIKTMKRISHAPAPEAQEKWEKIFYQPARSILTVIGAIYVLNVLALRFGFGSSVPFLIQLRSALIVICLAWALMRWKREIQISTKKIDASIAQVIGRLATFAIIIISAILVLQILGFNVMPLIAFGGFGAAALGFAAKDVIANFFGGFMLHITRSFTIGDLIILPDKNVEGHVENIGWYLTSIRDKDKRPVYLPNSFFATLLVINASRMSHRRFLETISIRYEDISKVTSLVEEIKNALSHHPMVDNHLPIIVTLNEFKDYSVDLYLDAYCLTTKLEDFHLLKQELLLMIYNIITKAGAEMPLPATIYYQKNL